MSTENLIGEKLLVSLSPLSSFSSPHDWVKSHQSRQLKNVVADSCIGLLFDVVYLVIFIVFFFVSQFVCQLVSTKKQLKIVLSYQKGN